MSEAPPPPDPPAEIPPIIAEYVASNPLATEQVFPAPPDDSLAKLMLRSAGSFLLAIAAGSALTMPVFLIAAKTTGRMPSSKLLMADPRYFLVVALATAAGFLGVGLWRIRFATEMGRPLPALFPPGILRPLRLGLVCGCAVFAVNITYMAIVIKILGERASPWSEASAHASSVVRVFVLLTGIIAAPCAEEIFFRGYIFGVFKRAQRIRGGILVSSVLFALAHLPEISGMPFLLLLGVVAALLYHRTGSLVASIACHAVNNFLALGFAMLLR